MGHQIQLQGTGQRIADPTESTIEELAALVPNEIMVRCHAVIALVFFRCFIVYMTVFCV